MALSRRFLPYLGLAAIFLLILSYYRDGLTRPAAVRNRPQAPVVQPPEMQPPEMQPPDIQPPDIQPPEDQPPQNQPPEKTPPEKQPPKSAPSSVSMPSTVPAHFHWSDVQPQFPRQSLLSLPVAKPQRLPPVQYDFAAESTEQAQKRKERRAAVKATFERCWKAYRAHAWTKDELQPLTGGYKDGFGGWAATLVDSLDNLWIMGLDSEFEDALQATMEIDLSTASTDMINVFETTIRHLGGLLSAYDLSGDERLLDKAREFGDMLLVPFDTPNRLPITRWYPKQALSGPQEADTGVLVAEIGSLTMEFTRLSQLTSDPRWFDAVDRITRILDEQQNKTHLPGMWPVSINAKEANFTGDTWFTLSAMSDSLYEYFPKMYALLGGADPVYKKMYDHSMATAIKYNLWRPMTPDNADILISGNVRAGGDQPPTLEPQGQHLVCFAGGMFALGGKIFDIPAHVEIGKKLTDGCIWAYKAHPMGIMPEIFYMVPCESRLECEWDEQAWRREVAARKTEEFDSVDQVIKDDRLVKGFTELGDRRYILRPEAIESIFILYRITGEEYLLDAAWDMFTAITNATETDLANAALADVSFDPEFLKQQHASVKMDSMESFWMAETLKYFYLIFSEPSVISLDEWVFNTEAHPFRRSLPS